LAALEQDGDWGESIYTSSLGSPIAVFIREREHSRFRGRIGGPRGNQEGAEREHGETEREHGETEREL